MGIKVALCLALLTASCGRSGTLALHAPPATAPATQSAMSTGTVQVSVKTPIDVILFVDRRDPVRQYQYLVDYPNLIRVSHIFPGYGDEQLAIDALTPADHETLFFLLDLRPDLTPPLPPHGSNLFRVTQARGSPPTTDFFSDKAEYGSKLSALTRKRNWKPLPNNQLPARVLKNPVAVQHLRPTAPPVETKVE